MSGSPTNNRPPQLGRPTYRVFLLKADGGIFSAEIIEAQSDDEAKAIASAMTNGHGVDLWERGRFLASYPPLKVHGAS
jgi:hypothetical protein